MDIARDVLAFAGERGGSRAEFEAIALSLYERQCTRIAVYGDFCRRLGRGPEFVAGARDFAALPQAVFKSGVWLGSEPKGEYAWVFRTSGTTASRRGVRPVARLDVYEEVCVAGVAEMLRREFPELVLREQSVLDGLGVDEVRLPFFFVKEPVEDLPDSSLSWMFEFWRRRLGTRCSEFLLRGGRIAAEGVERRIGAHPGEAVVVAGTALGLLRWAEERGREFLLPEGSVVIETGGFKGQRRELSKAELYGVLSEFFGVPPDRIVNEYGMTEIFSQTYARGLGGLHVPPRWLDVRVVDPRSGEAARVGEPGVVELVDLACVDSVPVVQTEDLAVMRGGGFELIGRVSSELRGCSLGGEG